MKIATIEVTTNENGFPTVTMEGEQKNIELALAMAMDIYSRKHNFEIEDVIKNIGILALMLNDTETENSKQNKKSQ